MEAVYHLRIKEDRAARIIEELIEADAVENLEEMESFSLMKEQEKAIDAELEKIEKDDTYLVEWNSVKGRFLKA